MKLKLLVLGVAIPAAANAATNVTLQNFSGVSSGNPIVDNAGTPIDNSLSSWAVGTFETAFAAGLSSLDTQTDDQAVIDAFTQSGADGSLSINGLFNGTVDSDSGNANAGEALYALVTYNAAAGVQALVFDLGRAFPTQDGAGNASVDLGRLLGPDDVAFGNTNSVPVDTSTLPAPFAGFVDGITFDAGTVISEPPTGPPAGYYDSAEGLTGAALKQALHEIIDDHIVISYSTTDEFMRVIDEDPQNSANVGLIYSNFSMSKGALGSSGASVWNREHLWPRSYGVDSSGPDNSDMHNLFPCNASVNSSRSNKYYDETTLPSTVNSVSPENTFDSDSWEPADSDKGIVARAVLYMAVRYEGDESATSDLELSDSPNSTAQLMGKLTTMLDWNRKFPPSSAEKNRNDAIYTGVNTTAGFLRQGNRNPFIDYPQLADAIFLSGDVLTFGKWQIQNFSFPQIEAGLATGALADPDNDGRNNLVEFVANSNPLSSQSRPFYSMMQAGGNVLLNYRIVNNLSLSGYSAEWEISPDLESWASPLNAPVVESDEGATSLESLTISATGNELFWRLKVSSASP